jgi:hypothetical protein
MIPILSDFLGPHAWAICIVAGIAIGIAVLVAVELATRRARARR